jgi:2'-5' RNA ligase
MRLFTAVDPSAEVHATLIELLRRLQPSARLRWTKPENLHLTLKFIGEWPEEKLGVLEDALRSVPSFPPFRITLSGLGFFPNPKAPRVFWVGIQAPPELAQLASQIDRSLEPLGIAPEKRAFSPHLTLARIPERTPLDSLRRAIESLPAADFGAFKIDRFFLYQSRLSPGGSVYTKVGEYAGLR